MSDDCNLTAEIKLVDLPDSLCFSTLQELIEALPKHLVACIPANITNVTVGTTQPTDSADVWFRYDSGGRFIGIWVFSAGNWVQFAPTPNGVFWMYGDSGDLPEGYILVDGSNPNFSAGDVTSIQAYFLPTPGVPPYTYFACTFDGI